MYVLRHSGSVPVSIRSQDLLPSIPGKGAQGFVSVSREEQNWYLRRENLDHNGGMSSSIIVVHTIRYVSARQYSTVPHSRKCAVVDVDCNVIFRKSFHSEIYFNASETHIIYHVEVRTMKDWNR